MHTILKKIEKVKEAYNNIADHFSQTRYAAWPEFEIVKKYLNKGTVLIDLGCGNGRFYEYVRELIGRYHGLDISENLLKIAQSRCAETDWQVGELTNLPYQDNYVDVVVSIAAFHHLPDKSSRLKALGEMKRVLKPGGIIFLTNWDIWRSPQKKYWWHKFWLKRSFNDFYIPWKEPLVGNIKADRYYYSFSEKELLELFKEAGLELIQQFTSERNNIVSVLKK